MTQHRGQPESHKDLNSARLTDRKLTAEERVEVAEALARDCAQEMTIIEERLSSLCAKIKVWTEQGQSTSVNNGPILLREPYAEFQTNLGIQSEKVNAMLRSNCTRWQIHLKSTMLDKSNRERTH